MAVLLPPKFKMPLIDMYDRSRDPVDHVENFKDQVMLHSFPNEIACLTFPLTLKGTTKEWFSTLGPQMIDIFGKLVRQFVTQFLTNMKQ